jgi:hypothetical protein
MVFHPLQHEAAASLLRRRSPDHPVFVEKVGMPPHFSVRLAPFFPFASLIADSDFNSAAWIFFEVRLLESKKPMIQLMTMPPMIQ